MRISGDIGGVCVDDSKCVRVYIQLVVGVDEL